MSARSEPVGIDSAEHYVWGGNSDGWHLLKHDDLSVIRERVPPGAAEVRHRHARSRQFFYVLEGEARLEVDGTPHVLTAGMGLHVPPGVPHQFRNDSQVDVHFLVVSSPRSHGDREEVPQ
jgi:mannose-6-phosphate isomerase-like protein (cupin superfamily)